MDIKLSTRPTEGIANVKWLIKNRPNPMDTRALASWGQLASSELRNLSTYIQIGEEKLSQANANIWGANESEAIRYQAEHDHILGLLNDLKSAQVSLQQVLNQPRRSRSWAILVAAAILLVTLVLVVALIGDRLSNAPRQVVALPTATPSAVYSGEVTPKEICTNLKTMTSAQWIDYSMTLEGKRVDQWTGWVIDVQSQFTDIDKVVVDVSGPNSILATDQAVISIPHGQAMKLNKHDRVDVSGTLLGAGDTNGVCAIVFDRASLIP